jgi:hypothetical protein
MKHSASVWLWAIALLAFASPMVRGQSQVNTIQSIKSVAGPWIEIEVHSTREFPVRDELVILRVGTQEFTISRSPEDGSLNTLIFRLTPGQWAGTKTGDAVVLYYGQDDPKDTDNRWVFGSLDKSKLKP